MKLSLWRTGPALLLVAVVAGLAIGGGAADESGIAVVELYTSEGCSSCPPADKVMTDLAKQYAESGQQVIWLGLHVDYWNKLGWTDPFSSRDYTQRQYRYAQVMRKQRVYTPQMIVDGRTEFVGSRKADAARAIDAALKNRRGQRLTISHLALQDRQVTGQLRLQPGGEQDVLVAVTENGLVSKVEAGENEGRTLHHDHVVRQLAVGRTDANGDGHFRLNLPESARPERCELAAVAQDQRTMRVTAAAVTALADVN